MNPRFASAHVLMAAIVLLIAAINARGVPTSSALPPRHDAVGNLIYDGKFIYHYDAWNRLVQVNRSSVALIDAANRSGEPVPDPDPQPRLVIGDLVKQYVYDALGRLVETRTPITDEPPAQAGGQVISPGPDGAATPLLTERFYYDGVRRIQETSEVRAALSPPENAQSWTGSTDAGQVVEGSRRFEREYIWGPGDGHAGVDELLALFEGARATEVAAAATSVPNTGSPEEQAAARLAAQAAISLASQSKPWWVIQDASGDVVALCDNGGPAVPTGLSPTGAGGAAIGPASVGTGRVVQQFTYDPYGAVLAAESIDDHPTLRVGHKGLFLDRLDVGLTTSGDASARLLPYAAVVYHVRNRSYQPSMGRWMQQDPNGTGLAIQVMVFHGEAILPEVGRPNPHSLYADGLNLYAYLGSSPLARSDPEGLFAISLPGLLGTLGAAGELRGADAGRAGGGFLAGIGTLTQGAVTKVASGIFVGSLIGAANADGLELLLELGWAMSEIKGPAYSAGGGDDGGSGQYGSSEGPKDPKKVAESAQNIARGNEIRDVQRLVREHGGKAQNWVKRKGWDRDGTEWHWYENTREGLGKVEWKIK